MQPSVRAENRQVRGKAGFFARQAQLRHLGESAHTSRARLGNRELARPLECNIGHGSRAPGPGLEKDASSNDDESIG